MDVTHHPDHLDPDRAISLKHNIISDTIIIAGVTIFAYLLTYTLEAGVALYFDYPFSFINPNWASIFITGTMLAGVIFIITYFASIVAPSFMRPKTRRLALLIQIIVLCSLLILYFVINIPSMVLLLIGLTAILLDVFEPFIMPLVSKELANKLQAKEEVEWREHKNVIWHTLIERIPSHLSTILLLSVVSLYIAFFVGQAYAESQQSFLVTQTNGREFVVLRIYGSPATTPIFRTISTQHDSQRQSSGCSTHYIGRPPNKKC